MSYSSFSVLIGILSDLKNIHIVGKDMFQETWFFQKTACNCTTVKLVVLSNFSSARIGEDDGIPVKFHIEMYIVCWGWGGEKFHFSWSGLALSEVLQFQTQNNSSDLLFAEF